MSRPDDTSSGSVRRSYIAVEGPIGVGKTSLAKRLALSLAGEALLEQAYDNPFLERFYQNPRQAALPAQLYFLFQRTQQINALRQSDLFSAVRVSDFMMEKDRLFARATLDDDELRLYEQVYAQMTVQAPQPDLVIYLQAPVEILLARIARRAVPYERLIESAYLHRLSNAYADFFHHYDEAPLLIINAAQIDPVNNEQDYALLLEQIGSVRSGRHYFNPLSVAL